MQLKSVLAYVASSFLFRLKPCHAEAIHSFTYYVIVSCNFQMKVFWMIESTFHQYKLYSKGNIDNCAEPINDIRLLCLS